MHRPLRCTAGAARSGVGRSTLDDPEIFSPRDLATLLTDVIASGVPAAPVPLGI
ncbi:hypothetical protein [Streptomyces sp. NBC_01435]|uniref:hypothetical protein n=1 Tax=Streptomyces sp. NBC_01435 TaxID=2903865 RepID=UPI002E375478|nr:hypothetical protein [Streptomyces sp. NBC_01435]